MDRRTFLKSIAATAAAALASKLPLPNIPEAVKAEPLPRTVIGANPNLAIGPQKIKPAYVSISPIQDMHYSDTFAGTRDWIKTPYRVDANFQLTSSSKGAKYVLEMFDNETIHDLEVCLGDSCYVLCNARVSGFSSNGGMHDFDVVADSLVERAA